MFELCKECLLPIFVSDIPDPEPYTQSLGYKETGEYMHGNCFWEMADAKGWLKKY